MDCTVVIVSYNTEKLLDDCLSSLFVSLKKAKISYEVIVVDNASADGTRAMLSKKYPQIITVLNSGNVGFGRANNQGIKKAQGEYVLLLNSDTVSFPTSMTTLFEFAKKHPKAFIGPKLLNIDRTPQTSCGPFFTLPVVVSALFLKGDTRGVTRWSPDTIKRVDWVSGACIIAKRTSFLDGLLFDENMFMYMEEVDLLMRANEKGYETIFFPGSVIIHMGSGSSTNKRKGPVLNIYKGLNIIYKKHYSSFERLLLRILLIKKACISIIIGTIVGSQYLKETYAEALRLV
jgi:GT2 family glycosyltransferase